MVLSKCLIRWGEYKGLDAEGQVKEYLPMNRVVTGIWYNNSGGLVIRSEYGHIVSSRANISEDGVYALAGYRIGKWLPVARWDMYRDRARTESPVNRDNFLVGCTFEPVKAVKFQLNYICSLYPSAVNKGVGNSVQAMCMFKF